MAGSPGQDGTVYATKTRVVGVLSMRSSTANYKHIGASGTLSAVNLVRAGQAVTSPIARIDFLNPQGAPNDTFAAYAAAMPSLNRERQHRSRRHRL